MPRVCNFVGLKPVFHSRRLSANFGKFRFWK